MRLLLDTHTLIWFFAGNSQLSATTRILIEDKDNNNKLVSIASIWEMAIKESKGHLNLSLPLHE